MHYTSYTPSQFNCLCHTLYQAREGGPLVQLFHDYEGILSTIGEEYWTDHVILGYLLAQYHSGEYDRLFETISRGTFPAKHYKELQDLWYAGRYKESEKKRQKILGAVEKYRIRRKFPPPPTIWDGQETVYSFKENSRKYLKQFYKTNPYPSLEQKKEICRVTDLELVQISNWFKNRRQREKGEKALPSPLISPFLAFPLIACGRHYGIMADVYDSRVDELECVEDEVTAVEEGEERDIVTDVSVSSDVLAEVMNDFKETEGEKKEEEEEPIPEGDPEMVDLDWDFFIKMKDQPNTVVSSYLPELRRRYKVTERRSKATEKLLIDLHPADRSNAEDRQEILGELLDKIEQALDIIDEHENRKIPFGHRAHLEARLLKSMNSMLDGIHRIVAKFDVIGEDRDAANNEREGLRYEIRFLDMMYTEIHESFLKSFLEMEW
ncbi:unc-39 [Pristionchus pacificus]|uniref:Unc-39 n=1 Tax=Pristionchus pacificus TaxID=54126 RepID=A0A2A6CSJ9_PRIPA|nr:unc-39 [Pristionchus pacificus]|eukprot:PDM81100.1 unc-39 [Pristionchus pacificus]